MVRMMLLAVTLSLGSHVHETEPASGGWMLVFDEECDGSALDPAKWVVERTDLAKATHEGHGLVSTRLAENVVVSDGLCHLRTTRQERVPGFPWATASIWTRGFHQQYGYFEARIRYGRASGLNNAFWLDASSREASGGHGAVHFEIDINEGHYPSQVNMSVHNWTNGHTQQGLSLEAKNDLSLGFHVYGLLWTEQQLTWFMDGVPIHSEASSEVRGEMKILLSTAVLPWAGQISDRLNGTSMDVDWVHAYQVVAPR
jgi:beta-glucanase (GH16 family)